MKKVNILFLILLLIMVYCGQVFSTQLYDRLTVDRSGGGDKSFYITLDSDKQMVVFTILRYSFGNIQKSFEVSDKDLYKLISDILNGRTSLEPEKESVCSINKEKDSSSDDSAEPVATGTWVDIRVSSKGGDSRQICNSELLDKLWSIENLVDKYFQEVKEQ